MLYRLRIDQALIIDDKNDILRNSAISMWLVVKTTLMFNPKGLWGKRPSLPDISLSDS
jgi:hypothetical protein